MPVPTPPAELPRARKPAVPAKAQGASKAGLSFDRVPPSRRAAGRDRAAGGGESRNWPSSCPTRRVYTSAPAKAEKASAALAERQAKLDAAEEEWLTLEEKAAG